MLIFAERLDDTAGGPSVSIPEFSLCLKQFGIDNKVFCKKNHCSHFSNQYNLAVIPYSSVIQLLSKLNKFLKQTQMDKRIIQINFVWRLEIILIILLGKLYRAKIILNPRGMLNKEAYQSGSFLKFPYFHIIIRPLGYCFVDHFQCSSFEESEALKVHFSHKSIFLNTLGYKKIASSREFKIEEKFKAKSIVSISRIDSYKRITFMIDKFLKSGLAKKGWSLSIYGAVNLSDYDEHVERFSNQELIDNQVFLNYFLDNQKKVKILKNCTFFISTSLSESFGLSIAESLDLGTPIIIRNNTIWEEYIKKNCGYSYQEDDIENVLEKITYLGKEDYRDLVTNIRKFYNPISWEEHTKIFLEKIDYNP